MSDSRPFLVTSHGWSASNWLAHALQLHPDVTCTHSARNVLADDPDHHRDDRLREQIRHFHVGYLRRQDVSFAELDAEIRSLGPSRAHGSVHLLRLRDLPVQDARFGDPGFTVPVVNLVRHPVDLVWSGYGQFRELFRFDINELYWSLHKVLSSAKEYVLDLGHRHHLHLGDFENLAFVCACAVLGSLRKDLDAEAVLAAIPWVRYRGFVRMEDVTRQPEVLDELLERLTNGEVDAEGAWLRTVYGVGEVNRHRVDTPRRTPGERFSGLEAWQKEVLLHYLQLYEIVPAYEEKGYDFSFIPAAQRHP